MFDENAYKQAQKMLKKIANKDDEPKSVDHFAIIRRGGLILTGAMSAVAFSRLGELSLRLTLIVSALALFIFGLWLIFQPQSNNKNPVAAAILTLIVMGVLLGL